MSSVSDMQGTFDYGQPIPGMREWVKPYQVFMGRWEGLCKTFSPEGVFLESTAVHMNVHWSGPDTWHLHEEFDNLYGVGPQVYHSDFKVVGKNCFAENAMIKVIGTGITAYNYNFIIDSAVTRSLVYNNHYFLDANTRRIMTHKLRDGKTTVFQIQDFVRVG
ncbi:MAG TPA: hypothetical protein PLQ83_06080 [Thermoflexales bacterium]|nr:hypothetical protein [Thermoflexales bacterium]